MFIPSQQVSLQLFHLSLSICFLPIGRRRNYRLGNENKWAEKYIKRIQIFPHSLSLPFSIMQIFGLCCNFSSWNDRNCSEYLIFHRGKFFFSQIHPVSPMTKAFSIYYLRFLTFFLRIVRMQFAISHANKSFERSITRSR